MPTVDVTVDAAATDWRGRVGVVPQLVPGARFDPDAATAFVCGPEIMMRYGVQALLERGVAPSGSTSRWSGTCAAASATAATASSGRR